MEAAPSVVRRLDEPRDRDVVRGEPLRDVGEHAGPVVDLEVDVEGRAQLARRAAARASRQHASFWRKPVPVVPMTLTMSATTADAVSMPPAPGPSSVISRIASPWSMTALKAPSTAASGWCRSTSAGRTRTSSRAVDERRRADEPDDHLELARGRDVRAA